MSPSTSTYTPHSTRIHWPSQDMVRSPEESWLQTPHITHTTQFPIKDEVETQFEQLLDNLQINDSVRRKFQTVSLDVKSSILHSSNTSNPIILSHLGLPLPPSSQTHSPGGQQPKLRKRLSTPLLRKARSSNSLDSPGPNPQVGKSYRVEGDSFLIVASPNLDDATRSPPPNPQSYFNTAPRGQSQSIDVPRPRPPTSRASHGPRPLSLFPSSSNGPKGLGIAMGEQPDVFLSWLKASKATDMKMEVDRMKKLRMLLRHESTFWVQDFVNGGGYKLILARLQDLLDIEWREEQHDDQMLYEVLRCVKALFTSEIGRVALRAHYPQPFTALSTLLFSEKKPGDLSSRQIIIELWLYLFDLFPGIPRLPTSPLESASRSRPNSVRFDSANPLAGMGPNRRTVNVTEEVKALLIPDIPDPRAEQHTFITQVHRPKVFKALVGELSDICRDYFWIMCHGANTLWALDEVDEAMVEKPVAPGGATGGVEFEAMYYVTTHFKLINALCRHLAAQDRVEARQVHTDLLASGMDRILVTMRKASTTYYPTVHLELARYVHLLRVVSPNARLPHLIDKLVGSPPEHLRKFGGANGWSMTSPVLGTDGGRRGGWDMQS